MCIQGGVPMDFSSYFPIWNKLTPTQQQILERNAVLEETNILKITHETIAGHMGTAREVVTRMLRYFQNEGMVKLARGTVEICEERRLQDLSDK